MKAQISRDSHRPSLRFSAVYHHQGAMVTDADLDERSEIDRLRTDNLGNDAIRDGVPAIGGALQITDSGVVTLQGGVIYADGVRGVLTPADGAKFVNPLDILTQQADLPAPPALPSGDFIIYADIWERPVFALEDPYLADAGLHGAVTGFRTRRMTQLKTAPVAAAIDIDTGTGAFPQIGTARLAITPLNAEILADECDPCAEVVSADQAVANALWRLEIIEIDGTPDKPSRIALAWSEENAAEIAEANISPEAFERANKVYEFFSSITESHAGVFADASDAKGPAFVDALSATPNPPTDHNGKPWPFVRRWDGFAVLDVANSDVLTSLGGGFSLAMAGGKISLRLTAFEAVLDINSASVVRGDYWLVELRTYAPEGDRIRLVKETPVGVLHHYCRLVTAKDDTIKSLDDADRRKLSFPVLANLPASHIAFDNNCANLYATAENVQDALDSLCSISADDINFKSNCPVLFDDARNVQEALDALCNIDFSGQDSYRHMFDWGVVCGVVPKLLKNSDGLISITPGSYLDRSGKFIKFEGVEKFDLSTLKIGAGVEFQSEDDLRKALRGAGVCLALAAGDGGKTSIHVIPEVIAYGPNDPSFAERVRNCVDQKKIVKIDDIVATLPERQKRVAVKVILASTGDGAFSGKATLTKAEFADSQRFREQTIEAFSRVAGAEDLTALKERVTKAEQDFPTSGVTGPVLEVRQMQQAVAAFAAFQETDKERLQRCICEALFPSCPPNPGKPPYFVPIACLRGGYDGAFLLKEVCPYCCRKQAMTWRSLQYFIGEMRANVAGALERACCGATRSVSAGALRDPDRLAKFDLAMFAEDFKLMNAFLDRPEKLPSEFKTKVDVKSLGAEQARSALRGTGIEVVETVDVNDAGAFDIIQSKLVGVNPADIIYNAGEVRPGDKVALLVQDGVARGYVLLERGTGKLPFDHALLTGVVTEADKTLADKLVRDVSLARDEVAELRKARETLAVGVGGLRDEIAALVKEREVAAGSLADMRGQLDALAKTRETLATQIDVARKELQAADQARKTMLEALRDAQPVNVLLGNKADLITRLAGEGITTVGEIGRMSPTVMKRLERAGILTEAELTELRTKAIEILKR